MPFASSRPKSEEKQAKHEARLAQALALDRANRTLVHDGYLTFPRCKSEKKHRTTVATTKTIWSGTEWIHDGSLPEALKEARVLPNAPFKVLDAPGLRDDYYCSIMAYSPTCNTLAVGLGGLLYGWSETTGVTLLNAGIEDSSWLTSVAFSSNEGGKSILAYGRSNGHLGLLSLFDSMLPRLEARHPHPISCLSWRPVTTDRRSLSPSNPGGAAVNAEDLIVGGENGDIYYYSVEWPGSWEVARDGWPGSMTLLARIKVHTQQICGLAWSPNGNQFATGGNDNLCCLFDVDRILKPGSKDDNVLGEASPTSHTRRPEASISASELPDVLRGSANVDIYSPTVSTLSPLSPALNAIPMGSPWNGWSPVTSPSAHISPSFPSQPIIAAANVLASPFMSPIKTYGEPAASQIWNHLAAVKAIAFCPWRPQLIATGGGSNDKMIHFFHTTSGAAVATISVSAQVTSLIWSVNKREIAATFGYAQPDHAIRIAVFSWPDCKMVGSVKWDGEHRALFAVSYPGGPIGVSHSSLSSFTDSATRDTTPADGDGTESARANVAERPRAKSNTSVEGCLIVASSDKSVKFHEVWGTGRGKTITGTGPGILGGSDIIEMAEGIDKEGDIIR
ncbi:hypothetical protein JX265_009424 [Neoarthrinium moseri]|uniref:WD40 repeat-like protein n=1 Tax=Neoarthrinium moseri TaxID=1658444 RepID=A0A9P9WGG8_9PEZI|nr:hypothetical protein JX266_011992 [Neoarthrinium moseri]KAI1861921.1 hypothetical protein JX265_009424 [Neoarthrinium moseri]